METEARQTLDLFEVWIAIWRKKVFIIASALVVGVLFTLGSFLLSDVYRAEVLLASAQTDSSSNRLGAIGGGLGGFASLAGLATPQQSQMNESIAVLKSRQFAWQFVEDQALLPVLFADKWDSVNKRWADSEDEPSLWDAYERFSSDVLHVSQDSETELVTLAVEWTDPKLAASWANSLVELLNDYQRERAIGQSANNLRYLQEELSRTQIAEIRQTIFELIGEEQKTAMFANAQKEFAFRVLDRAAEPERRVRPNRLLIAVLTTVMAGALAALVAIGQFAYQRRLSGQSTSHT